MKPIRICCRQTLSLPPKTIAENILDLGKWPEFTGYGVLPGVKQAEFECRTDSVVGTRIRVTNTDGSKHVEEIVHWDPARRITMRLSAFSAPLSVLADYFDETWEFTQQDGRTHISRGFELHAKSVLTYPAVWLISRLMRAAVAKHLTQMRMTTTG